MVEIENGVETQRTKTVGPSAYRAVEQVGCYFLYFSATERPAMIARLQAPRHAWLPVKPPDGEAGPTSGQWVREASIGPRC
jgi:hypothetical protein